jgi:hypothetical protein
MKMLRRRGIICEEQRGFRGMVGGIKNDIRIVCAEITTNDGFSGISLWLYGEKANWYLGLWSGVYFSVRKPDRFEAMLTDIFSGKIIPKGKAPGALPQSFM